MTTLCTAPYVSKDASPTKSDRKDHQNFQQNYNAATSRHVAKKSSVASGWELAGASSIKSEISTPKQKTINDRSTQKSKVHSPLASDKIS